MSTTTESDTDTSQFDRVENAIVTLDDQFAAVALNFEWAPGRKSVTADQRRRAADEFNAESDSLSASKKLLDTRRNTFVRSVENVRRDARAIWKAFTLPYPKGGIRLIKRSRLTDFQSRMESYQERLRDAKRDLQSHRDSILEDAQRRLGELYDPLDYPRNFEDAYQMSWGFPNVRPPEYLRDYDPQLYEAERTACRARLQEAVNAAEQEFSQRVYELTTRLADALRPSTDGRRRVIRDTTVSGLQEFFTHFGELNLLPGSDLEAQVERLKSVVSGEDAESFRSMPEAQREAVTGGLDTVIEGLEGLVVNGPRRRVVMPAAELAEDTVDPDPTPEPTPVEPDIEQARDILDDMLDPVAEPATPFNPF